MRFRLGSKKQPIGHGLPSMMYTDRQQNAFFSVVQTLHCSLGENESKTTISLEVIGAYMQIRIIHYYPSISFRMTCYKKLPPSVIWLDVVSDLFLHNQRKNGIFIETVPFRC